MQTETIQPHDQFGLISLADLVEAHDRLDGTLPDDVLERVERPPR